MAETSKQDLDFLSRFEPDVFWHQHGQKIVWGLIGVVAVILIAAYTQRSAVRKQEAAALRLEQAADPGTLQAIAKEFQGKEIGAQALLRLAEREAASGRTAEAAAAYQQFIGTYPQHALAPSAQLGLATALEAQGSFEQAKAAYLQLAGKGNYVSTAAKFGAARSAEALGQTKEARQLYEELLPSVVGTAWEGPVMIRWSTLTRVAEPAPAAAETTSPAPAPAP